MALCRKAQSNPQVLDRTTHTAQSWAVRQVMRLMWRGSQAARTCMVMASGWRDAISFLWFCFSGFPKDLAASEEKDRRQIWGHEMRPRPRKKIQRNFKKEIAQLEKQGTHGFRVWGKGKVTLTVLASEGRVWGHNLFKASITVVTIATSWHFPFFPQHYSFSS